MTFSVPLPLRRAVLLGLPLAVAACDLVSFVSDPKPILEQTWSIPADTASISVAEIMPNGVNIYSSPGTTDSSAFQVTVNTVPNFSRVVGADCPACVPLNGTTTIKPSFVIATGTSTTMPGDVVSASLVGGQVNLSITNGLSFDPLRVKTIAPASTNPSQQGRMVIVVRSGSLVVGKDSVNGATTAFAPGAVLNRQIALTTGNISSALAVDLVLTSPASDNNVPINSNAVLSASASVPDLRVAQIRVNVVNQAMTSVVGDSIPLDGLDDGITKHVVGGGFDMTITNPFNVSGSLSVQFGYAPGQSITKTLNITPGPGVRQIITLTGADTDLLFGATQKIALSVTGSVNSPAPIDVTPKQVITIASRLILTIRTPD